MRINSPYITGSATITGNLCVQGTITGTITGIASTASYAETLDGLDSTQFVQTGSFNSYTSSASSSLGDLSGSVATTTNTLSSSVSSSIGSLSGSVATTTSDLSSSIGSLSGSVATTASGLSSSIGSLSSSVVTTTSDLSSSVGDLSSSVATTTSGLSGRITTIEGNYATTGSNIFVGSQTITGSICSNGNIVTTGQIVAQTINVQQVTSSIVYSCGSNIFGNSIDNIQQFTGSILGSGSLCINGPGSFSNTLTLNGANNVIRSGNELRFNRADNAIYTRLYDAGSLPANGFILDNINGEGFHFQNNGTTILRIDSCNNFGVGTMCPITKVDIVGNNNALSCNNTLRFTDTDTATEVNQQIGKIEFFSCDISTPGAGVKAYIGAFAQDSTPDAYLSFATQDGSGTPNPIERLRITSEGTACFGGTLCANYLYSLTSVVANDTLFTGGNIRKLNNNQCIFFRNAAGDVESIISGNGNVGIGTTTPSAELQVNKNCDAVIAISNCVNVTSGNRGSFSFYNCATSTVGLIRAAAVTDNVGTELQFHTRPAAGSLTQVMTLGSTGVATFACQVCSAGTFISNVGASTSTYGFTHCGSNGYYGRFGVPNSSYMYLETNANSGVYIDSTTRTNYLSVNAGWSSGGGATQPLQVKSGIGGSGIWVESCSSDAGGYINMNGNCMTIGQSYRTSAGYNDIIFQTAGTTRMIVRCAGNVEVQTGIISPMFMIERNSAFNDITTGQYLNLNDAGTVGLDAKFHQQFAPFVNSGEGMTWNYARVLIRMTSTISTFSQAGVGCIRNATYFYGSGWICFGTHVMVSSTMDSARGFRWVVMPWFSYSDFVNSTDVPGLGLYNQYSDASLRIGAVYLQYKT